MGYGEGRDALICAAVDVVAERGLHGLTFRSLADRAGVTNSLVAHHFGTKAALLAVALDWAVDRSIENTGAFDMSSAENFAATFLAAIQNNLALQAFQYEMILESRRDPTFRASVVRLYERYQALISESLRAFGLSGDLTVLARKLTATLDGIVLQFIVGVPATVLLEALQAVWYSLEGNPDRARIAAPAAL